MNDLNAVKSKHSKVLHLKHTILKMRNYLLPNKMNITQDEIKLIFRLRCRVIDIKTNVKGAYDSFECKVCNKEEETQEHILKCEVITEMKKLKKLIPEYNKLFYGKVTEQLEIARCFKENMDLRKSIVDKK